MASAAILWASLTQQVGQNWLHRRNPSRHGLRKASGSRFRTMSCARLHPCSRYRLPTPSGRDLALDPAEAGPTVAVIVPGKEPVGLAFAFATEAIWAQLARARGHIETTARASNEEMRPKRPVPSGCCQKARLRRCSAGEYTRYSRRLAPSIHRFLAQQRIRESKSDRLLVPLC